MRFGKFPVAECQGAILAHSIRAGECRYDKGQVLTPNNIAALKKADVAEVMAAFLEDGDIEENEAAERIARAICGRGLKISPAATGRANIRAARQGLFSVDQGLIDTVNGLHEGISIATLPHHTVTREGGLVTTVKIVPFALPESVFAKLTGELTGEEKRKAIATLPMPPHKAGLIQTELPGMEKKLLAKTQSVIGDRLKRLGSRIAGNAVIPHHEEALAETIASFADDGLSPILIMGASASLDRHDVVPEAIVRSGGKIIRFGMPVDPGNLLVLGRRRDVTIIGLPGCARSPARNGFDQVLEMVLAGLDVSTGDIAGMGAGGLLKEGAGRPQPREVRSGVTKAGKIAAIVLAAGQSRRMGADNKLLVATKGGPLIARAVANLATSSIDRIVVVLGHQAEEVRAALDGHLQGHDVEFVTNEDFKTGMGGSIGCGISTLEDDIDAVLIVLGDMPLVAPETIDALVGSLDPVAGITVAAPTCQGKRGNPVIWDRSHFADLIALHGDTGARDLLSRVDDALCLCPVDDPGILFDVDTRDALQNID